MIDRGPESSEAELIGSGVTEVDSPSAPASDPDAKELTWLHGIVAVEAIAGGIALILPITPNKTGGDGSMADLFYAEPTYWDEVFVGFVFGNILIAMLILVARIMQKRSERAAKERRDAP